MLLKNIVLKLKPSVGVVNAWKRSFYSVEECGTLHTEEYRMYLKNKNGEVISPFHDIPLVASKENKTFNMVVEIPRWTNAKMEIATKEPLNPIKQDVKGGIPRFTANIFPWKGYIWNYGAFPQTWENPEHCEETTSCKGDNDPIDVCEIGSQVLRCGEVVEVKVLGVLAMIDQGEMDWKVIAINTEDPFCALLDDIGDVDTIFLDYLSATRNWFRTYKIPDKKPANSFSFKGEFQNRKFAENIINEGHTFWKKLIHDDCQHDLNISNTTTKASPCFTSQMHASEIIKKSKNCKSSAKYESPHEWHFLN